jgi:hypothetical protein
MNWTMPRPVVQGVGALLALTAAGSFALGVMHAPERGRLPGERAPGTVAGPDAAPIVAPDATPLAAERIEGPPPAPKPEKKDEATNTEAETADAADQLPTIPSPKLVLPPTRTNSTTPTAPPSAAGDLTNAIPADEEPPH